MGTQNCLTARNLEPLLAATKHPTEPSVPGTNISYTHKSLNSICTKVHFKRHFKNLMPLLMSKHHPYPPTRHFSTISFEAHISGSCFWSILIRSCFTMSAMSFLKTGKELYLLSAWIKLVHLTSGD